MNQLVMLTLSVLTSLSASAKSFSEYQCVVQTPHSTLVLKPGQIDLSKQYSSTFFIAKTEQGELKMFKLEDSATVQTYLQVVPETYKQKDWMPSSIKQKLPHLVLNKYEEHLLASATNEMRRGMLTAWVVERPATPGEIKFVLQDGYKHTGWNTDAEIPALAHLMTTLDKHEVLNSTVPYWDVKSQSWGKTQIWMSCR